MIIPTLEGWATGEKVTAAKLNAHTKTAFDNAVFNKPFCHIRSLSIQAIPTGVETSAVLNTVVEDSDGMADTANNRIVIRTAGRYRIAYNLAMDANATGQRYAACKNAAGTTYHTITSSGISGLGMNLNGTFIVRLSVGDALRIVAWQNSTVSLNANSATWLTAEWIGK